jgi:hypothetical protein
LKAARLSLKAMGRITNLLDDMVVTARIAEKIQEEQNKEFRDKMIDSH